MRPRRCLALVCIAALAGCSALVSTQGLSGGPVDASTPDGTTPGEGGADAAPTDAPIVVPDAGETATRFCATPHAFCAAFDDAPDFAAGWTSTLLGGPSALQLDLGEARSKPASLFATLGAGDDTRRAALEYAPPAATTKMHVVFDMKIDARPTSMMFVAVLLAGTSASFRGEYQLGLYLTGDELRAQEHAGGTNTYNDTIASGSIPTGRWVTLDQRITLGAGGRYVLSRDGTVILDMPLKPYAKSGFPLVEVGVTYMATGGAAAVHFDNVAYDPE